MAPMLRLFVLAIALLPQASEAQRRDLLSDEQRWAWAVDGNKDDGFLSYLRSYPEGAHATEARSRVKAAVSKPLGRLSTDTPECRRALQDRVKSMLDQPVAKERLADYDFTVAGDALLAEPSLVIVPKGQAPESTRIEDWVELNLVAGRRGTCTVVRRWSYGSGLPKQCGCVPIDPAHDFGPPPRAEGVLKDQARMQAGADACRRELGRDLGDDLPKKFLELRIDLARELIAGMKERKEQGRPLLPTEQDEMESWGEALPYLSRAGRHEEAYQEHMTWLNKRSKSELEGYCGKFAERVQDLMNGLVLSTKMRR